MSFEQQNLSDVITFTDIAKRVPAVVKKIPHVVKGLLIANSTDSNKSVGFALMFEQAAQDNPTGTAILYQDTFLSYAQLNDWANQIAHYFIGKGLTKGDVAAIYIENRPELLVSVLAMAKLGVISALVNTSQTGKVLAHSVNLVKPKIMIVGEELREHVDQVQDQLEGDIPKYWFADNQTLLEHSTAPKHYKNLASEIQTFPRFNPHTSQKIYRSDGLFYIYTSGTTGLPKAVVFTNGRWMKAYGTFGHIMNLNQDDVIYVTLPLYHATGMVIGWCCAIVGRGGFAIRRKFSAREFWPDIIKYNASAVAYVGELCRYLMDVPPSPTDRSHRVTRMIGNGMRPNIWGKFKERFGIEEFLEFYASSEGNVGFSNVFNFDNTVGFSPTPYAIVEFDKNTNMPVRDAKGRMVKVAKGGIGLLIGEITERSPFDGYTDPQKNIDCIYQNVFKKGDSYFNTGDLVRNIGFRHAQFIDRIGDTYRWKGENVSTCEVENHVSEYTKLHEAVVYGVEIPNTNGRAGMATITPNDVQHIEEVDYSALLSFFKSGLPHYAIPVFLRIRQTLETTGTFKYQKNTLKTEAFDPAKTSDQLLVWLPGTAQYTPVTKVVFNDIMNGKYRF